LALTETSRKPFVRALNVCRTNCELRNSTQGSHLATELGAFMAAEAWKWGKAVKFAGIKPD
jgi:hypothetical protein